MARSPHTSEKNDVNLVRKVSENNAAKTAPAT